MSFGDYLRASLLVPWTVGVVCLGLLLSSVFVNEFVAVTAIGMIYGGIPYVIYGAAVYAWSLKRSDAELRERYWLLPSAYLLLLALELLTFFSVNGPRGSLREAFPALSAIWLVALAYAYGYALVFLLAWRILCRCFPGKYSEVSDR